MKKVLLYAVTLCLTVGVITGCSGAETATEYMTDEYITDRFYEAYDFWSDWVYGQKYRANDDAGNPHKGRMREPMTSESPIQSVKQLREEMEKCFTKELTDEFFAQLVPKDMDGKLYLYCGDVGGSAVEFENIVIEKANDEKYVIQFDRRTFYEDCEHNVTPYSVYYVFENGKWVFENSEDEFFYSHGAAPKYLSEEFAPYNDILRTYYSALFQKWDIGRLWDEDLCYLVGTGKHDNVMKEIGYCFMDVNADNQKELLIGEIENGYWGQVIYDLYTVKDGKVHKILFSHERNRYLLFEENGEFKVANEGTESAAKAFTNYYAFNGSDLKLERAVILDGTKTPGNEEFTGFFVAYDDDFNTDNDTAIDQKTATEIIESYQAKYITPQFIPFDTLG